jgi:hypothetical protein
MNRQKVTRRDALGMIGKSGITLSAGPFFFLSLGTSPLDGDSPERVFSNGQVRPPKKKPSVVAPKPAPKPVPEKVIISGSGSKISFRITGPRGRHCGVAFALADSRQSFKAVPGGRGVIGKNGVCIITIDTKTLPNQRLFLRVVTGSSADFKENVMGSKAFEIVVAKGAISRFVGVRERSMENAGVVASVASAGYQSQIR